MMTPRRTLFLLAGLLVATLPAQRSREDRNPPKDLEHGEFYTDTFRSKALGRSIGYGIYLPAGYNDEENKDRNYPMAVWLHGMFEDHERFHRRGGTNILDKMIGDGEVPEMIFVTADGGRSSFYVNGEKDRYEDMITEDLLAYIAEEYRVSEKRCERALMGVSMGGYGALKIALRNPQLFGVVAAHSAAVMPRDPGELEERFPWLKRWGGARGALGKIFGDPVDRELWDRENLLVLAEQLEPKTLGGLKVYMDCGDEDRYGFQEPNQELHGLLEAKRVPHTWRVVEGGNHGWRSGYNQAALPHSLAFVAGALAAGRGSAGLKGLLGTGKQDG